MLHPDAGQRLSLATVRKHPFCAGSVPPVFRALSSEMHDKALLTSDDPRDDLYEAGLKKVRLLSSLQSVCVLPLCFTFPCSRRLTWACDVKLWLTLSYHAVAVLMHACTTSSFTGMAGNAWLLRLNSWLPMKDMQKRCEASCPPLFRTILGCLVREFCYFVPFRFPADSFSKFPPCFPPLRSLLRWCSLNSPCPPTRPSKQYPLVV